MSEEETKVEKAMPKAYIALIGFIMFFLPLILFLANHLFTVTLERSPPEITLIDIPKGLGAVPVRLTGIVKDIGSGIKSVKISMNQGQVSVKLLNLESTGKEVPFEIKFDDRLKAIEEGEAVLIIEAKDSAKNVTRKEYKVLVDRKRPKANLALPIFKRLDGTPDLCFVVAEDENLVGGSMRGRPLYPGTSLDPSLKDVFVAWVPNRKGKETKVFFDDAAGNTTSVDCTATIEKRPINKKEIKFAFSDAKEIIERLEEELKRESNIFSASQRLWSDVFTPISKGRVIASFGDLILDFYPSLGIFYQPSESQKEIISPSNGVIRKIFDHSAYGKTIVIDFGLDLIGTISGFKVLEVTDGDFIKRGDFLGVADKIPFTDSRTVLFTLRIGGDFVDPNLFLDSSSYVQAVPKRIGAIKRLLGISITNPLER